MIKTGISLTDREKILSMQFGCNGAATAADEVELEKKIAEIIQFVRMSNLDLETYMKNKIVPKLKNNLCVMWQEKWLGTSAWNNNNSESVNHMLKLAVDWKPQQ